VYFLFLASNLFSLELFFDCPMPHQHFRRARQTRSIQAQFRQVTPQNQSA
jgi:hypothetical protein